ERRNRVRAFKQADGHPSALAHQVLAQVVYDELQRRGIAPRRSLPAPALPPPPDAPAERGEPGEPDA
ncbi:MAG: hypothetical protein JOZ15_08115, partial [Acidobacteria bacterium]|nr:hypothetical protein [Acidobacteriota bacterium]